MPSKPTTAEEDETEAMVCYWPDAHDGPGWYYYDAEYPEEGSCGAFATKREAIAHARDELGYAVVTEGETND